MVSTPIILRGFITRAALVKAGNILFPPNNGNYHPRGAVMRWISQIQKWSEEKGCSLRVTQRPGPFVLLSVPSHVPQHGRRVEVS